MQWLLDIIPATTATGVNTTFTVALKMSEKNPILLLLLLSIFFKNSEGGLLHSPDVMVVAGLPVYVFRIIFTAPVLYYNLTRLTVAPHFR